MAVTLDIYQSPLSLEGVHKCMSSPSSISDIFRGRAYLGKDPHADFDIPPLKHYDVQIALITFVEQLIDILMGLINAPANMNPDALTWSSCFTEDHIRNYRKVFNQKNPQLYVLPPSILDHNIQRAADCLNEAISENSLLNLRNQQMLVLPVFTNCTWGGIHIDRVHKAIYFVKGSFFRQHMGSNGLDYHALVRQEMETVKTLLAQYGERDFHIVDSGEASPSLLDREQEDGYNCGTFLFALAKRAFDRLDREPARGFLAASNPEKVYYEILGRRFHMLKSLENMTPAKLKTPPSSPASSKEGSPRNFHPSP